MLRGSSRLAATRLVRPSLVQLPTRPSTTPAPPTRSISLALGPSPGPQADPQPQNGPPNEPENNSGGGKPKGPTPGWDSAKSTFAGLALLAVAGIGYHQWYKMEVLRKMRRAFGEGYDPVLELANANLWENKERRKERNFRIRRSEQEFVNKVVNGEIHGEYVLLLGPKGVGKTTLLVEAMLANDADGVAMVEAHEDPEVFRLRLGKALDFEFNEDSFAGLFQRRDPREAGPLLDIERALNKLEKVAIRYRKEKGRPLCLIFNNIHFIHDDEDGHSLLHMLQQRAESWAQAGVLTTVFNSDDHAPYRHLKKNASRMRVVSIRDLTPSETHLVLSSAHPKELGPLDPMVSFRVWDLVGGRLAVLSKLAGTKDLVKEAKDMVTMERHWLEGRLGLIPDHDDDVMDEQKVSSCSFLLFHEFARQAEAGAAKAEAAYAHLAEKSLKRDPKAGIEGVLDPDVFADQDEMGISDPMVTYGKAREIMTRPDYMLMTDHHNIINIDANHMVRPDSRLMLSVFRELCGEEDFQERLDNVRDRVDEIESLHRTSELTVKKDNDLGGFLRLRVGDLRKVVEDGDGDEAKDEDGHLV